MNEPEKKHSNRDNIFIFQFEPPYRPYLRRQNKWQSLGTRHRNRVHKLILWNPGLILSAPLKVDILARRFPGSNINDKSFLTVVCPPDILETIETTHNKISKWANVYFTGLIDI